MPDRVWQRPTAAGARNVGGSDAGLAGGVRDRVDLNQATVYDNVI